MGAHGNETKAAHGLAEMKRERFAKLVEEALEALPERFARLVKNVAVVVEDEPPADRAKDKGGYKPRVEKSDKRYG